MKKKSIFLFLCAFYASVTYGYSFKEGGVFYNITSSTNMTVEVTSGNEKYEGSCFIPEYVTHDGQRYYVTAINSGAFSGCTELYSVSFDSNTCVTSIGSNAFSGCNGMGHIEIPASVTSIGNYAFSGCKTLRNVTIEDATTTLSLGYGSMNGSNYGLFADCPLTKFYWGRPLSYNTSYGFSPIAKQYLLTDITIGPNVSTITAYMFYGNSATSIELPTTVTTLGNHAFDGFTGLKSFTIPEHITSIGEYAFANCTSLTSITIPAWITTISAGTFAGCTGFKSFVIPNTVSSIGNYAFNGCTSMTGVTFEEGEESLALGYNYYNNNNSSAVGKGLFYDCPLQSVFIGRPLSYQTNNQYGYSPFANNETLTKAHFGNPLKYIGAYSFYGCKSLKTLQYNSNCKPTSIAIYAFCGCKSLTETDIVLPKSIEIIGDGAFQGCTSLEGYTIPNHIKTVGKYAFQDCEKMKSVVVKPSVQSIGNGAFNGCVAMTGVVFEESEESLALGYNYYNNNNSSAVGKGLFYDCPLQSVFIGRPLSYQTNNQYGYSPFANNETLTKAHFGNPLTTISSYLFYGCKSLNTFQYNSKCKLTAIESYAFAGGCKGLTSYDIPETVTSIGNGAFRDCEKLTSIVIKPAVTSIGNFAFNGCASMTGVTFEESEESLALGYNYYNNNNSSAVGKGLFYDCPLQSVFIGRPLSYQTNNQYGYSPFANNEIIESAHFGKLVTSIPNNLFRGNTKLNSVVFDEDCKLESVGGYAFDGCKMLPTPIFPNTITSFGDGAFNGCAMLTDFELPENLVTIGKYAFQNCTELTTISIPVTTTSIGNYAYNGCSNLIDVTVKWRKPITINAETFSNRANATLHVPNGCIDVYKAANYWKEFKGFVHSLPDYILGDANSDGSVNVSDVVAAINYIMEKETGTFFFEAADANRDGELNIGDIILIVKMILNSNSSRYEAASRRAAEVMDLTQYTAAQFEVIVADNTDIKDIKLVWNMTQTHQLMYEKKDANTYAVVVFSPSNELMIPENNQIVDVETDNGDASALSITNVVLAKPTGEIDVYQNLPISTGIQQIENESDPITVYDLKGNRLNSDKGLRKGIYIINGKKTVVR